MGIKPLEKQNGRKQIKGLLPKILFITVLFVGGILVNIFAAKAIRTVRSLNNAIVPQKKALFSFNPSSIMNDLVKRGEHTSAQVLGLATKQITNSASISAALVSDFVFENTFGKVIEQIKKLPQSEQLKIKQEICR